jgi:hypothetical protein
MGKPKGMPLPAVNSRTPPKTACLVGTACSKSGSCCQNLCVHNSFSFRQHQNVNGCLRNIVTPQGDESDLSVSTEGP